MTPRYPSCQIACRWMLATYLESDSDSAGSFEASRRAWTRGIVRDLTVLARDQAIATAYLVAGDEDLCEGVQEAQDQGIRVVLVGVPGVNQSRLLTQQADEELKLGESWWRRLFRARRDQKVAASDRDAQQVTAYVAPMRDAFEAAVQAGGDTSLQIARVSEEMRRFEQQAREAGERFAHRLVEEWTPPELEDLRRQASSAKR